MRTCKCCGFEGSLDKFYSFKRGDKTYTRYKCKECYLKETKANTQRFHRKNKPYTQSMNLKRKYGITVDDYNKMYKEQNGKCKICQSEASQTKRSQHFHVDHCHITGKIRGLLCHRCNSVLGFALDSPLILKEAINYLKSTK